MDCDMKVLLCRWAAEFTVTVSWKVMRATSQIINTELLLRRYAVVDHERFSTSGAELHIFILLAD